MIVYCETCGYVGQHKVHVKYRNPKDLLFGGADETDVCSECGSECIDDAIRCDGCGEYFAPDKVSKTYHDEIFCHKCMAESNLVKCPKCQKAIESYLVQKPDRCIMCQIAEIHDQIKDINTKLRSYNG